MHIGGQIGPNPPSVLIEEALFLKLADSRSPPLNRRRMVRIERRLLIPGTRKRNGLHALYLSSNVRGVPAAVTRLRRFPRYPTLTRTHPANAAG